MPHWEENGEGQGSFSLSLDGRAPGIRAPWASGNPRSFRTFVHSRPRVKFQGNRSTAPCSITEQAVAPQSHAGRMFPYSPPSSPGEPPRRNFPPRTDLPCSQQREFAPSLGLGIQVTQKGSGFLCKLLPGEGQLPCLASSSSRPTQVGGVPGTELLLS